MSDEMEALVMIALAMFILGLMFGKYHERSIEHCPGVTSEITEAS